MAIRYPDVVRVRGLPYEANALSIVEFFDYRIDEFCIHFVQDKMGVKPHGGEAFVDCKDQEQITKYHKKHMGHRYVEVLSSTKQEKSRMKSRLISMPAPEGIDLCDVEADEDDGGYGGHSRGGHGGSNSSFEGSAKGSPKEVVLKCRGLPFSASKREVIDLFRDYHISEDKIWFDVHHSGPKCGKNTGNCFVVFEHEDQRNQACQSLQKSMMGDRYIDMFEATERDCEFLWKVQCGRSFAAAGSGQKGSGNTVRLWGLPFGSKEQDVIDFFHPEFVITERQIRITRRDGRVTGECFVDMDNSSDCDRACSALDRRNMGDRYIEVYPADRNKGGWKGEGKGASSWKGEGKGSWKGDAGRRSSGGAGGNSGYYGWLKLRGLPYDASAADVVQFMGFNYPVTENDVKLERGQAFVRVAKDDVRKAVGDLHRQHIGSRYVEVFEATWDEASGNGWSSGPYGKGEGKGWW